MTRSIPARYEQSPDRLFMEAVKAAMREGDDILDVGAGRSPTLEPQERPAGGNYVGLDLSRDELVRAGTGSYSHHIVTDVSKPAGRQLGRFDLVLCRQVLEHVRDTETAFVNLHGYLRPGGSLVAILSGRFSVFGLLNRVIPERIGTLLMRRLLDRDPDTVFRAYYRNAYASALKGILPGWSTAEVTPLYQGAAYFNFSPPLRSAYLVYEDWAVRTCRRNLATHYLIVARR